MKIQEQIKKLKTLGVKAFNIIARETDNLLVSKSAIQAFPIVMDNIVAKSKIRVKDLDMTELKQAKAHHSKLYRDLFKLFKDETVEDAKGIMKQMAGKVSEAQMELELEASIDDLILKVFNEKKTHDETTETKTEE